MRLAAVKWEGPGQAAWRPTELTAKEMPKRDERAAQSTLPTWEEHLCGQRETVASWSGLEGAMDLVNVTLQSAGDGDGLALDMAYFLSVSLMCCDWSSVRVRLGQFLGIHD